MVGSQLELAFSVQRSSWVNPANPGVGTVAGTAATNSKGTSAGCDTMAVYVVSGNFRLNLQPIILQGGGYVGQNTSSMLGEIVQFNNLGAGNTSDWGAWGQAGFMFTKELGIYGFAGVDHPDATALRAGGQQNLMNVVTQGMLRYLDGGFAYGLEWTHWHTDVANPPPAIFPTGVVPLAQTRVDVNQLMLSTYYFF